MHASPEPKHEIGYFLCGFSTRQAPFCADSYTFTSIATLLTWSASIFRRTNRRALPNMRTIPLVARRKKGEPFGSSCFRFSKSMLNCPRTTEYLRVMALALFNEQIYFSMHPRRLVVWDHMSLLATEDISAGPSNEYFFYFLHVQLFGECSKNKGTPVYRSTSVVFAVVGCYYACTAAHT